MNFLSCWGLACRSWKFRWFAIWLNEETCFCIVGSLLSFSMWCWMNLLIACLFFSVISGFCASFWLVCFSALKLIVLSGFGIFLTGFGCSFDGFCCGVFFVGRGRGVFRIGVFLGLCCL